MITYFCPFCSSLYQFHKTRSDGVLVCGHCGDPLIIKPLITSRRIFGLFSALVFITPLLFMIFFIINDVDQEKKLPYNPENLVNLSII